MTKNSDMNDVRLRLAKELHSNFMVEAAAGTGKTTSMVTRMVNMVAEGACEAEHLAAVTFTRKAAAELRDRFEHALASAITKLEECQDDASRQRLANLRAAADSIGQTFIGTIHSFCAQLIRQRPIEFGVNPGFRELEADEDSQLLDRAWQENLADLYASKCAADGPVRTADDAEVNLLDELSALGLETSLLRGCFNNFVEHRDIEDWPSLPAAHFDLAACQAETRNYIEHMRALTPLFPVDRGTDELMSRYELIVRTSTRSFTSEAQFFRLLGQFDHSDGTTQSNWHDKSVGKREQNRFNDFRDRVVEPALTNWRQRRYRCVIRFVQRALSIHERLKQFEGVLDFTDLLLIAAKGLREQPHLRSFFQRQYTHLLVDEFQDTDPIQAETVILLASDDIHQRDWQRCRLRPGALFIVGDPKQSIYRFRRGDIVTYSRVKEIIVGSNGQLVSLTENFRSSEQLLAWNNAVFATMFPNKATEHAPAHAHMQCGRNRTIAGQLSGVYQLSVEGRNDTATRNEAEHIARFIRHAIDTGQTIERWSDSDECYQLAPVRASDFLILTRIMRRIGVYKAALERHGIACEVSGNNALADNEQLNILLDVLRAADDPFNPVHYLSLLRERLFGFSDAELYELKRAKGTFIFTAPLPDGLEPGLKQRFEFCTSQMQTFQFWLRSSPPVVALEKIAASLGLLAEAAAGDDGNVALGSLLKAFEVLRAQSHAFDNAADLIAGLEQLLEIKEADSVTAMGNAHDAVRIMNLHKAKGLEAPIVFLADTAAQYEIPPRVHISRCAATPQGAMCISQRGEWNHFKSLAEPVGWDDFQAEEKRFLDAEEIRLLYVATTRAANMLVVSVGDKNSAWSKLHSAVSSAARLPIPTDDQLAALTRTARSPAPQPPEPHCEQNWIAARQPTYSIINVKKESLRGSRRPDWQSAGEYGMIWGTAVHQLLEMAGKSSTVDLRRQALALAMELDISASRVEELCDTVRAVIDSDVWQRSLAARCRYTELPFDVPVKRDGQTAIVRGVIDLIFEEPDGWVIVDYKSDSVDVADIDSLCNYYRPQLAEYANHWQSLTGHKVKELGLYATRLRAYRSL